MRRIRTCILLAVVIASLPVAARAARPDPIYGYITMSDGISLKYQALLPDPDRWGPGPYPMVMDYSGYIPAQSIYDGLKDRFRESGYAVIGLNMRGTHCSAGTFDYFEPRQALDGKEAIEWLTQDPTRPAWSNGRLAMVGKSYPGITQLFVAAQQPKGLVAIVPGHVFGDLYRDVPFPGGILNATFAGAWSGQRAAETMVSGPSWWVQHTDDQRCMENQAGHVANTPFNPFVQAMYNQYDGPLFWERSPWWWADRIAVPTMLVEAWQDEQVGSRATNLIERLAPVVPWKMVAANGDHGEYYGEEVLPHIYRFLEYTLRGSASVPARFWEGYGSVPAYDRPPLRDDLGIAGGTADEYWAEDGVIINVENGARTGRRAAWSERFSAWPPRETAVDRFNFRTDGTMTPDVYPPSAPQVKSEAANARLAGAVDYAYLPYAGTQERGGQSLQGVKGDWNRVPPAGSYSVFTTAPLAQDRLYAGTGSADLWISSTAPDTDIEVTLTEVRPDGQELFVQKGWLRASHRIEDMRFSRPLRPFQAHTLGSVAPLTPAHPAIARVEIFPFAHMMRAGSKIRLWVSAPNIMPDLWGFASLPTPAINTIYTSSLYPSSLALPLIPGRAARDAYPACGTLRNQPCRLDPFKAA